MGRKTKVNAAQQHQGGGGVTFKSQMRHGNNGNGNGKKKGKKKGRN